MINGWENTAERILVNRFKRIALFGDNFGVPLLTKYLPQDSIRCIVASSIRPQYIDELAKLADEINVKLLIQPRFASEEYPYFLKQIKALRIDLLICISYSMMIRQDILKFVNYNAVNMHCALLPKNRGCNPIQWAIIRGETETGVTLHYLNEGIDCGDIIAQEKVHIDFEDTWFSVSQKVAVKAEELIKERLPTILEGNNKRYKQDNFKATFNKRLNPESPKLDFTTMTNLEIYNLIRAQVKPLKGAYIDFRGMRIYFAEFLKYEEIEILREKYG